MPLLHAVLLLSLVFATAPALAAEAYPPDGTALPVVKNTEDAGARLAKGSRPRRRPSRGTRSLSGT
jgi:hypothetical protein